MAQKGKPSCTLLRLPLPCRKGFPAALRILDDTVANMTALLSGSEVDINNISMRVAMDITGEAAFDGPYELLVCSASGLP